MPIKVTIQPTRSSIVEGLGIDVPGAEGQSRIDPLHHARPGARRKDDVLAIGRARSRAGEPPAGTRDMTNPNIAMADVLCGVIYIFKRALGVSEMQLQGQGRHQEKKPAR